MAEYIEREAFIEAVKDIPMWGSVAVMFADSIPAVDVAPITPGRWLNFDELYALAEQELMSGALEHEEYDAIINFIDAAPVVESVSIGRRAWIPGNTCGAVNRGVPVAYWMPLPELPEMDGGAEDE